MSYTCVAQYTMGKYNESLYASMESLPATVYGVTASRNRDVTRGHLLSSRRPITFADL